jgi:hypothetical protein
MSSNKKTIVVFGATGNQGASVAHTFLALPNWHVRAVTRNPSSPAAEALSTRGAEVVKADLSSASSLPAVLANATAIFLNTDFWETYRSPNAAEYASKVSFEREVSHGKNAAIAAADVPSLEVLVYSALGPMKRASKGKYRNSYHWESKAAIVDYIEHEQPALAKKFSVIYPGAYNTNALLTPRLDPASGTYQFVVPMAAEARMPIYDPKASTGPFVRALIEGEKPGTKLLAYDQDSYLSMKEVVAVWSKVSGQTVEFVEVSAEFMNKKLGIPVEVLDAPGFILEFGYMGGIEGWIEPGQLKMKTETKSFEKWLGEKDLKELLSAAGGEMKSVRK